ncbi:hypothetical protein LCGC14_0358100 [marine sediment metagenome]|uniref:Uncharacterized protein n=1 Tax=marine sediment metagenome TaxID=412755 RepID=A0A0F9TEK5_9ZZZZ
MRNWVSDRIRNCEQMRWFHGIAYRDYSSGRIVTFIFPLNHLVALGSWIRRKIRHAPVDVVREEIYQKVLNDLEEHVRNA